MTTTLTEDAEQAAAVITKRYNARLEARHQSNRPALGQDHRAHVAAVLEAGEALSETLQALTAFEDQAEAFGPARLPRRVSDPATGDHLRGLVARVRQFVEPVPARRVTVLPTLVRPDFARILARIFGERRPMASSKTRLRLNPTLTRRCVSYKVGFSTRAEALTAAERQMEQGRVWPGATSRRMCVQTAESGTSRIA